jgi:hypothetical protein
MKIFVFLLFFLIANCAHNSHEPKVIKVKEGVATSKHVETDWKSIIYLPESIKKESLVCPEKERLLFTKENRVVVLFIPFFRFSETHFYCGDLQND